PDSRTTHRDGLRRRKLVRAGHDARDRGARPTARGRRDPAAICRPPLSPPWRNCMSRRYTEEHEWVEVAGTTATVGITDHAQSQLGDIVFVEVPASGRQIVKGEEAAVVESVKAASDVYSPVS